MNILSSLRGATFLVLAIGVTALTLAAAKRLKNPTTRLPGPDQDGWAPGPIAEEFVREFNDNTWLGSDEGRRDNVLSEMKGLSDPQFVKVVNTANGLLRSENTSVLQALKDAMYILSSGDLRDETIQRIVRLSSRI